MFTARRSEIATEIDRLQTERHELIGLITKQEERVATLEQSISDATAEADDGALHIDDRQRLAALRVELTTAEQNVAHAAQRLAEAEGRMMATRETFDRLASEIETIDQVARP